VRIDDGRTAMTINVITARPWRAALICRNGIASIRRSERWAAVNKKNAGRDDMIILIAIETTSVVTCYQKLRFLGARGCGTETG
jgi:hypothetical protein